MRHGVGQSQRTRLSTATRQATVKDRGKAVLRHCRRCNTEFTVSFYGTRWYCTKECWEQQRKTRYEKLGPRSGVRFRECKHCGEWFSRPIGSGRITCGKPTCVHPPKPSTRKARPKCKVCGEECRADAVFCSYACRFSTMTTQKDRKAGREAAQAKAKLGSLIRCVVCGVHCIDGKCAKSPCRKARYAIDTSRAIKYYSCSTCRKVGVKTVMRPTPDLCKRCYQKACVKRRRAKIRSSVYRTGVNVAPREIFERDRWICSLCRRKCRPHRGGYQANGATLDHVIPLSRGGQHTCENLQTMCHECNSKKRDTVLTLF